MKMLAALLLALVVSLTAGLSVAQQAPCQPSWMPTFGGTSELNGTVNALTVFDDGSGSGPALFAGWGFTSAGGLAANHIAKLDGSSWSALGSGIGGIFSFVNALGVFDDGSGGGPALYVAGGFPDAGGISVNNIAKWDGSSWSDVGGGTNNIVQALTVFDDGSGPALYAAGFFTTAGGVSANRIAKWDGATWSPLGSGLSATVRALTVFDEGGGSGPALYAGGSFTSAGGVSASRIAKWDGSSWSPLGSGLAGGGSDVNSLVVFDDGTGGGPAVYAGGRFASAGGVSASRIAKWDGSGWSALGSGTNNDVKTLVVYDDGSGGGTALYAGGIFTGAVGVPANRIAKWNGSSWSALGSGMSHEVSALTVFDDGSGAGPALYAGGAFTSAGGVVAKRIAKWDGMSWSNVGFVGGSMNNPVQAMAIFDDGSGPALYAGGSFTSTGAVAANRIAKWDGSSWSALGSGMNSNVHALTVFDDGSGSGPSLFAGGSFTSAGGLAANYIAKWDGSNWSPLGSGMSTNIHALAVFDDGSGGGPALYAGGLFTSAGGISTNFIAKWNGSNWSNLGSGMAGTLSIFGTGATQVKSLAVFDDGSGPALYAGGDFMSAGEVTANGIAKWDGSSWSALGSGMEPEFESSMGSVDALTVFDDGGGGSALFAGGNFEKFIPAVTGFAFGIAKWDGSSWSYVPPVFYQFFGGWVRALVVFDDGSGPALYAGGTFMTAGGVLANSIAKWDGANWSALGSGLNGNVNALTVFDDGGRPALFAGGTFTTSPSGDSYLAKWGCPPPTPTTLFCTAKTTLVCGAANISATGTSSATVTSGFVIEAQPVLGCRGGLLLYSDQPVQPAASFGGAGNGVLCLSGMGLRRAGPIESGGLHQPCDGVMSIDMNAFNTLTWTTNGCNPTGIQTTPAGFLGNMGTTVSAQMWGRDSIATGQVLSDGISWVVGP